jgi:hypothetical protein
MVHVLREESKEKETRVGMFKVSFNPTHKYKCLKLITNVTTAFMSEVLHAV